MTDEEKAIDYATTECCRSCSDSCKKEKCKMFCNVRNAVLYGLEEGKRQVTDKTFKKVYQSYVKDKLLSFDLEKTLSETRDILKLKKENEQLKTVCDYNCPVHKLVTHNTCLTCSAIKSSPHFDFKDKSDEEIKQIQAEAKLEAEMD